MYLSSFFALLTAQLRDHPFHILFEAFFAAALIFLLFRRGRGRGRGNAAPKPNSSSASSSVPSSAALSLLPLEEQERRIAHFRSRLFRAETGLRGATKNKTESESETAPLIEGRGGARVTLRACGECLDLATDDFHSLSTHADVVAAARAVVVAYGVGSCGPRGFYGTVRPHMVLEEDLAKFLKVEDAIVYSFAFSTVSTLISCYAGRGEYLVVDEDVNLSIIDGCDLSRAHVRKFRHNDMQHLETILSDIEAEERRAKKTSRRFVVTEGVFRNNGDVCDLPRVLELCNAHKFRIILEDSYGFGCLGATARGTPEHFGIAMDRIDIYVGSLSTSLGAVGGFCAGEHTMIEYQRLAATAYVFSASLPPYVTTAASTSLKLLDEDTSFVGRLQENAKFFRETMRNAEFNTQKIAMMESVADISPIVVLRPSDAYAAAHEETVEDELECVVQAARKQHVLLLRHLFDEEEKCTNKPGLRIMVKGSATKKELQEAAEVIIQSVKEIFA